MCKTCFWTQTSDVMKPKDLRNKLEMRWWVDKNMIAKKTDQCRIYIFSK